MYICAWLKNNNSVIPPRLIFREGGVRFGQVNLTTKNTLVCFFFFLFSQFFCLFGANLQSQKHEHLTRRRFKACCRHLCRIYVL